MSDWKPQDTHPHDIRAHDATAIQNAPPRPWEAESRARSAAIRARREQRAERVTVTTERAISDPRQQAQTAGQRAVAERRAREGQQERGQAPQTQAAGVTAGQRAVAARQAREQQQQQQQGRGGHSR